MHNFVQTSFLSMLVTTSALLLGGFVIEIDKFEHNYLINLDNGTISKVNIKYSNYEKMNLVTGNNFEYMENNKNKKKQILKIIRNEETLDVFLKNDYVEDKKIAEIVYFLEKRNFWKNLFL